MEKYGKPNSDTSGALDSQLASGGGNDVVARLMGNGCRSAPVSNS
jgi:hypothetical protein